MLLPVYVLAALINILAKNQNFNVVRKDLPYDLRIRRDLVAVGASHGPKDVATDGIKAIKVDVDDINNNNRDYNIHRPADNSKTTEPSEKTKNGDEEIGNSDVRNGAVSDGDGKNYKVGDKTGTSIKTSLRNDDYSMFMRKLFPGVFRDDKKDNLDVSEDFSEKVPKAKGRYNEHNPNNDKPYGYNYEELTVDTKTDENLTENFASKNTVIEEPARDYNNHIIPKFLAYFIKQNQLNSDKTRKTFLDTSDEVIKLIYHNKISNIEDKSSQTENKNANQPRKRRNTSYNGYNDLNHNHNDQTGINGSESGAIGTKVDQVVNWFKHLIHPQKEKINITEAQNNKPRYNGFQSFERLQYPDTKSRPYDASAPYKRYAPHYNDYNQLQNIQNNYKNGIYGTAFTNNPTNSNGYGYKGYDYNGYGYNPFPTNSPGNNSSNDVDNTTEIVVQEICFICVPLGCPSGFRRVGPRCVRMSH